MATTKKAPKTVHMTANVLGRVTSRTRPPYLAQLLNNADKPTQIVILVNRVERAADGLPPFARATVVSSRPGAVYYKQGEAINVDNFGCLRRLELASITEA